MEVSPDELIVPDEFKQIFRQTAKDFLKAVEVTSGGEGLLHIVDVAHVPAIHLEHPDWFLAADNWPAWTAVTRKALFDRAAEENLLVASYHFPFPGLGRVTKEEIGWAWTPEG